MRHVLSYCNSFSERNNHLHVDAVIKEMYDLKEVTVRIKKYTKTDRTSERRLALVPSMNEEALEPQMMT